MPLYYYLQPAPGYLRIAGPDQAPFLQRQTTNDVRLLKPGRALWTVLTSPTGRILDVLTLLNETATESIAALTLPGYAAKTARYLQERIFFMDKVTVHDASAEFIQVDLFGAEAAIEEGLVKIGVADRLDEDEVRAIQTGEAPVQIIKFNPACGLGYRLLAQAARVEELERWLESLGLARLEEESYQVMRIEAGLPAAGHELTEAYTPLETGLSGAISTTKGCYTGQEIIARQITYDKVTTSLVGLHLEGPVGEGQRAWVDGRPVGEVTSFALSPRLGAIALAVLKRPFNQPGVVVQVGESAAGGVAGIVSGLPFG